MNGIINVYKEQNMTSHDCVAIMRGALGIKKIGHTGTLDPMATGVLPICIGKATRVMDYMNMDKKEYVVTLKLGVTTETQDIWGQVIEERPVEVSQEQLIKTISKFQGNIKQIPPKYSALKVNGKKLYDYARAGETVEIKPREVTIYNIEINEIHMPKVTMTVLCSKGTYIRTLCNDIGEDLGCGGTLSELERTKTGPFESKDGIPIMKFKNMSAEEAREFILPTESALVNFPQLDFEKKLKEDFVCGRKIPMSNLNLASLAVDNPTKSETISGAKNAQAMETGSAKAAKLYKVFSANEFIGIGKVDSSGENFIVDKVFLPRDSEK